jgi:osmotically-inducible protein OsmY
MRRFILPISLVALLALLLPPVTLSAQISDRDLGDRVVDAVTSYANFTIFDDVNIEVDNRNVRLTGRVTTPVKKDDIGKRVAKIDGIRTLTNDIGVLPLSPYDAELRTRVARAIYNHPSFWQYAAMASPPIHIIVENSRITLTGRVNSETERMLAFSLAHVGGALDVTNRLKLDRDR